MHNRLHRLRLAIAGACLALLPVAPSWPQVGIVRTVEGAVNVSSGREECAPRYGLDLDEGDAVRTGPKAWALLSMMDGTKITVRPDTEVRITTYRFTDFADTTRNRVLLVLNTGALRVVMRRLAASPYMTFRVQTPEVMVELHGTDQDVSVIGQKNASRGDAQPGTYVKAYAGDALMKNRHGEAAVQGGQIAFSDPQARVAPRVLSSSEPHFYYWHDYIDRRVAAVAEKLDALMP